MNKYHCIFLFLIACTTVFAQSDSLKKIDCGSILYGKVIDDHDKTPLEFATLYIKEIDRGATADRDGNYKFENMCDGEYIIKVSHIGCDPIKIKVSVKGETEQNFYPEHHAELLQDIEIKAKRPEEKPTQTQNDISGRDLEESKGESLGEALKNVTGITAIETGSSISKPVIHGLHSNRILVLNNGVRQEGQQWGSEHAPEIDPFIANKLTVIKGANSVRYGSDAIAGVILVEPKALRDSAGIGGELSLVGFTNNREGVASGVIEQKFKKLSALSWRLQGTLKQAGNSKAPDYWLKNTGFKEQNFSSTLGWNKENYGAEIFYSQFNTTLGIFSGSHIGNLTDLQAAFNRSEPIEKSGFSYKIDRPYQHVEHELVKVKSFLKTGAVGKLSFVYARQYNLRNEYDKHKPLNDSLAALNRPELQYEITTHTADVVWEHNNIRSLSGSMGISGMTQGNTYEGRYFIPNYKNYSSGAFWIERWRKNKLEVEAGIRYDYKWLRIYKYENSVLISPIREFSNVSGNLGLIYKISPSLDFNINTGNAWRAPAVNELYSDGLHHGAAAIEVGDKNLLPERAYNSIATLDYNKKKWNAELSVYYNHIQNFIYLQPTLPPVLTIRGAFPAFHYKQVDATFKGVDAMLSYDVMKSLKIISKASWLRAYNKTIDDYLILMPSDRYENELVYELKDFKKVKNTYFGLAVSTVTKQWRTPVNNDFAPPPEGYTLFNFNMGFSIQVKKQLLQIGFSGNNLLNTVYRDYLNRFRYYSDAMGRNFAIRIKIPFNVNTKNNKKLNK